MTDLLWLAVQSLGIGIILALCFVVYRHAALPVIAEIRGRLATHKAWRQWRKQVQAEQEVRRVGDVHTSWRRRP